MDDSVLYWFLTRGGSFGELFPVAVLFMIIFCMVWVSLQRMDMFPKQVAIVLSICVTLLALLGIQEEQLQWLCHHYAVMAITMLVTLAAAIRRFWRKAVDEKAEEMNRTCFRTFVGIRTLSGFTLIFLILIAVSAPNTFGCDLPPTVASISYPSTDTDGSFTVSWSSVSGATSYYLFRSPDSNFSTESQAYSGASTSYSESGLADGTYYYRVVARNACGVGETWREGGAIVVGSTPPCSFSISPTSTILSSAGGSCSVSVDASAEACEWVYSHSLSWISVTSYDSPGDDTITITASPNTGGVRSGTMQIAGNTFSVEQEGAALEPPTSFEAHTGSNSGEITLYWTAAKGATGYLVFYDEDSINPPWSPSQNGSPGSGSDVGNVNEVTITDLRPGQIYNFAVSAYNESGVGEQTSPFSATASYSVTIQSNPPLADVYLGTDLIGTAPVTIAGLNGLNKVFVRKAGYQDCEQLVSLDDDGKSLVCELQTSYYPEWEEKSYSWISSYPIDIQNFSETELQVSTDEKLNKLVLEAEKKVTGAAIKKVIKYFATKAVTTTSGILYSIIQDIPIVGWSSDRAVVLMADGQIANQNLAVNKEYVLLYIYMPVDSIYPPREIEFKKANFCSYNAIPCSWSNLAALQLLTEDEANSIMDFPLLIVKSQPIVFSEVGIYKIDGIQFEVFGDDANDNGLPDNQEIYDNRQSDICILKNVVTGDQVTVETSSGSITRARSQRDYGIFDTANKPTDHTFGYGMFNFIINDISAGEEIEVTFHLPQIFSVNDKWMKYYEFSGWEDYTDKIISGIGTKNITLVFKDGSYGDGDGIPNGVLVDPGGPAYSVVDVGGDEESGENGGGGCFITTLAPTANSLTIKRISPHLGLADTLQKELNCLGPLSGSSKLNMFTGRAHC